ncbi:DNA polymerase III subunit gamma/tau [Sessilibacter sp. MAH2]
MSYQVLARKWRPRNFHEMVGQEHVLRALINALDHNRLHHAYLFTGTRGVGKTTIARILAKCLNCESGVSSNPCGQCGACREIAEGRFVDLIEVDAASRTKVEDTRELLDNVQYAPTRGRYKVYLIDEVHMLSGHSFNALLKTLEEPPPHVKFLLATTDPQKLPVTILSRCLQFHLKNMSQERIVGHLSNVLEHESIRFEDSALWQLARAADGSMRDALSLTDQAIAFGNGSVSEAEVSSMLGTIDRAFVYEILVGLAEFDSHKVLNAVAQMAEQSPDYPGALAELISVLHRIALAQVAPQALDNSLGDREQIVSLASQITSEDVQLFYQMALHGRRDLPLNPDLRSGLEMTLLRMLAFKPQGVIAPPEKAMPKPSVEIKLPEAPKASPIIAADSSRLPESNVQDEAKKNSDQPHSNQPLGSAETHTNTHQIAQSEPAVEPAAATNEAIAAEVSNLDSQAKNNERSLAIAQQTPDIETSQENLVDIGADGDVLDNKGSGQPSVISSEAVKSQVERPSGHINASEPISRDVRPVAQAANMPSEYDDYAAQMYADEYDAQGYSPASSPDASSRQNAEPKQDVYQPRHQVNQYDDEVDSDDDEPVMQDDRTQSLFGDDPEPEPTPPIGATSTKALIEQVEPTRSLPQSRPAEREGLEQPVTQAVQESTTEQTRSEPRYELSDLNERTWLDIYPHLGVTGILQSTVSNCVFTGREGDKLHFLLDSVNATLYLDNHQQLFSEQLSRYFDHAVTVVVEQGSVTTETPAARATRLKHERHAQAVHLVQTDPFVQRLVTEFAVELDPDKIEPMV